MRKLTAGIAIAGLATMGLAACGQAPDDTAGGTTAATTDAAQTTDAAETGAASSDYKACMVSDSGGFDDKSFNQSGYEGLKKAQSDLGIQEADLESTTDSDFAPNINSLIAENCNLIVTVGFLLVDATKAAAEANPDINFAIVDDSTLAGIKNVRPLVFNTAEASFLAGYLAAGMTKTGTVATYGGMQIPSVTIFMDGFVEGVAKYNEDKGKDVKVLGWDEKTQKGQFTESFEDTAKGKTLTKNFIDQGADIIHPVAGPVGLGTLAAAKDAKDVSVIWVDADGYETTEGYGDIIMTSVVKEIGASVYDTVKAGSEGNFSGDSYVGTLENGGVSLAPYHDFDSKIPDELKSEIDQIKADIIAGKITVESPSTPK